MGAPAYRIAPFAVVLAIVAVTLALGQGWFSGSDATSESVEPAESGGGRSAVVWAVGDGPDGGPSARRVARLITRSKPDRVLYLGDVYNEGTRAEFAANFDPLYGKIAKRVAPTPGNHDWPLHSEGYDVYWREKLGREVSHYYAFKSGGWQILSLNSEMDHDAGSPQVEWLRSQLKGGTCRIAFWHRPRWSAGTHHGDQPDVAPLWDALEGHAAIALAGHEHDLQRFKPRDGITEFVSGAGGRERYPVAPRDDLAFSTDDDFGALRLALSPGLARYRFVSARGRTLDSGKVRCRTG
jgi:3',5'-cyclic AMP phosphodiesterase CpdA